ncbi:mechanosensitive ion channel family protein [Camelimonas abortus]|uniref:Mechanosensitive ion channel family protein n=1 Tax=Camelimonas abortus TaxID=1017184 RepID=A0ABV7LG77_9HYPH
MPLGTLSEFLVLSGLAATLGLSAAVVSTLMRRRHEWSHSILAHLLRIGLLTGMVFALRRMAGLALDHYDIPQLSADLVNTLTAAVICAIVMRELFMLINRLTHAQILKGSDPTSARAIARVLKLGLALVAALAFGEHFGIGFSGLLAFGGIGGIAVGLASKDILGNVFSGIMLFFDRPFNIGDWVSSPDRKIEGTVEEIGWRMTRIMTFDHRPLYVPNSVFSSICLENPGRMTNRRIMATIGLRYEDAGRVEAVTRDIRDMLRASPLIDQSQTLLVYFNEFAASSLNIMVYCFTRTTNWGEWLEAQQEVFLGIIRIVQSHGADFAFPTQTLYLAGDGGAAGAPAAPGPGPAAAPAGAPPPAG